MSLAGISEVYSIADDLLERLLCIRVSRAQIYRVTDKLGETLEDKQTEVFPHAPLCEDEYVYGSMDGSMILTEQGWKEVKLGRVFRAGAVEPAGKKRNQITESLYSACLGSCHEFLPRFEASLGAWGKKPDKLVFITDGAEWIHNYLKAKHPEAIHMLDYYHAVEKLTEFAKSMFPDEHRCKAWLDNQTDLIWEGKVKEVIKVLDKLLPLNKTTRDLRDKLKGYYWRNADRMVYDQYRAKGLMIGSGPMEAAHRTVLQARMKRSGQHWSIQGAKNMINLRVAHRSDQWDWAMWSLKQAA